MAEITAFAFLLSGQFWAANFLAIVATLIYSMSSTGVTEGNLKWQLPMTNWKYRLRFIGILIIFAVISNAATAGVVTAISDL